jgi:hypothetical protein
MTAWKNCERRICTAWGGQRSGPLGRDGPDCTGTPVAIQVKRTGSTTGGIQGAWIAQAKRDAKRVGLPFLLVVAGHNDRAPVAVVDHAWLLELATKAGLLATSESDTPLLHAASVAPPQTQPDAIATTTRKAPAA